MQMLLEECFLFIYLFFLDSNAKLI